MSPPDPKTRPNARETGAEAAVGPHDRVHPQQPGWAAGDPAALEGTSVRDGRQIATDGETGDLLTDDELDRQGQLDLVARIVAREQEAFAELLDRYQGRVYRMIRRMWSTDRHLIEDLSQEVFLRVYRGLQGFQGDCALGTWIHRITLNVCISELRQRKALKRDKPTVSIHAPRKGDDGDGFYLEPRDAVQGPADEIERRELYAACRRAIHELPDLWRVILTLRDLEGRSYEEIAETLDLPIGTVRSRLHRARARVRRKLDAEAAPAGGEA